MPEKISSPEQLTALFHRALHRIFHHLHRHGSHAQDKVLALLSKRRALSQRELLAGMGIRPASLSELLGKLEKNGAIRRERDRRDKRNVIVTLTEQGVHEFTDRRRNMHTGMRELFAPLNEEEQAQLTALLSKLVTAWEAEQGANGRESEWQSPHARHGMDEGWGGYHDHRL